MYGEIVFEFIVIHGVLDLLRHTHVVAEVPHVYLTVKLDTLLGALHAQQYIAVTVYRARLFFMRAVYLILSARA